MSLRFLGCFSSDPFNIAGDDEFEILPDSITDYGISCD